MEDHLGHLTNIPLVTPFPIVRNLFYPFSFNGSVFIKVPQTACFLFALIRIVVFAHIKTVGRCYMPKERKRNFRKNNGEKNTRK